jgi:hypothetical protein
VRREHDRPTADPSFDLVRAPVLGDAMPRASSAIVVVLIATTACAFFPSGGGDRPILQIGVCESCEDPA